MSHPTPVYDRSAHLVAWVLEGHLFDPALSWIAFLEREYVFSAKTLVWLGVMRAGALQDTTGHVVAWQLGAKPFNGARPVKPMLPRKPIPPVRPLAPMSPLPPSRPLDPTGGWSPLSFAEWLGQAPPAPVAE